MADEDIRLVREVEKYPHLYDTKRADYKDQKKKDVTWARISSEIDVPAADCKSRWRSLRDRFVREKKNLIAKADKGAPTRGEQWALLEPMAFLWDLITHRKQLRKEQPVTQQPEWVEVAGEPFYDYESGTPDGTMTPPGESYQQEPSIPCVVLDESEAQDFHDTPAMKKRRLNDSNSLDRYSSPEHDRPRRDEPHFVIEQPEERSARQPDEPTYVIEQPVDRPRMQADSLRTVYDEDELFCLSVAASLRRLNGQKKALAKLKIQQALYEIEFLSDPTPGSLRSVLLPEPPAYGRGSFGGSHVPQTMPKLSRHPSPPVLHAASSTASHLDYSTADL